MRTAPSILFVLLSLAVGRVFAEDAPAKDAKATADGKTKAAKSAVEKAKAKAVGAKAVPAAGAAVKERVIDFTKEEEIRGVLTKPEAELVGARRRVQSKSLLPIRLHFIPEMMKTVQEL
ncbi:MAG: hypothetical protein HYY84_06440 [Deltaproteobacteria bacterium]|nr:hypothetical protein [Deltaproteobacteria bacterium]